LGLSPGTNFCIFLDRQPPAPLAGDPANRALGARVRPGVLKSGGFATLAFLRPATS